MKNIGESLNNEKEDRKLKIENIKNGEKETNSQFNNLNKRAELRNVLLANCKLGISKLKNQLSRKNFETILNDILCNGDTDLNKKIALLETLNKSIDKSLEFEASILRLI